MSASCEVNSKEASCFGVGQRIAWNPKGYGRNSVAAIGAEVMVEIEGFVGAEATIYGFTPAGALGSDHGALVLELELGSVKTCIGVNFGARDWDHGPIRRGFDVAAWREAPLQWESAGIWLANAEDALAFLCGVGRLLEVRSAIFVYGNEMQRRDLEQKHSVKRAMPRFQLGVGAGHQSGSSYSFVGLACAEVLRRWTSFSGAEMDVRFFTPPEATWIDHVAMVIEVRKGSRRACVGAHFGASFANGEAFRKMLDTTSWNAASTDWRSSGLYLLTWAEAWAFICGIGWRLNVRSARMSYGEGEATYLVRISDGLDAT